MAKLARLEMMLWMIEFDSVKFKEDDSFASQRSFVGLKIQQNPPRSSGRVQVRGI
jgi:hypothetical protein